VGVGSCGGLCVWKGLTWQHGPDQQAPGPRASHSAPPHSCRKKGSGRAPTLMRAEGFQFAKPSNTNTWGRLLRWHMAVSRLIRNDLCFGVGGRWGVGGGFGVGLLMRKVVGVEVGFGWVGKPVVYQTPTQPPNPAQPPPPPLVYLVVGAGVVAVRPPNVLLSPRLLNHALVLGAAPRLGAFWHFLGGWGVWAGGLGCLGNSGGRLWHNVTILFCSGGPVSAAFF
jgi:hypothetical protein